MATATKTNAADKGRGTQQTMTAHMELINACIGSAAAAIVMAYVVSVAKPGMLHAVLAVAAIGAIVWAYLQVAKSTAEGEMKAGAVVGSAVIAGIIFYLLSMVL